MKIQLSFFYGGGGGGVRGGVGLGVRVDGNGEVKLVCKFKGVRVDVKKKKLF